MIDNSRDHYFSTILGHEFNIAFLKKMWADGKVPPSILFTGPAGVGKKSLAYAYAKFILSDGRTISPETGDVAARKIERGLHPDFYELAPRGALGIVPIDEVRDIQDRISLAPNEAPRRFVLLPRAEGLQPASANALLKSLEEPPDHVLFVLVCENPDELLPTILSRCMKLPFYPVAEELLEAWLQKEPGASPDQARLAARLAQGRPGEALALLGGQTEKLREAIRRSFDLFFKHGENAVFLIAAELDKTKAPLPAIVTMLIGWFRDMLLVKAAAEAEGGKGEPSLMNFDLRAALEDHARHFTRDQMLRALNLLIDIQGDMHRVLYKTLVFEHIFLFLSGLARENERSFVV